MSQHNPSHHKHEHAPSKSPPIHHKWWFWAAVLLMLAAMGMYVASQDESLGPGGQVQPAVPAAP
jgi:hypothetical protein